MLNYGIIGNCKTCALIKKNSSVDWMCYPTFASPSIFAKILDKDKGGFLKVQPIGKYKVTQRYIPNTAVLETTFKDKSNEFKIIDFFPRYRKLTKKNYERLVKQNRLIRIIKPIKGNPQIKVIYEPRPNYAKKVPELIVKDNNLLCKNTEISLITNINYNKINKEIIDLNQTKYLIVGKKDTAEDFSVKKVTTLLNATKRYWERWTNTLVTPNKYKSLIIRSAITLKLLTYSTTGAILAAATTSIPEEIDTPRTWDYRFCWIRDSVFCADALEKIGRKYEAKKLLNFFINEILNKKSLQIMYGIEGETKLTEKILSHLSGFQNTKPVRIGNAAYNQIQHDIYGEIIDLMYLFFVYHQYEKPTNKHWRLLKYTVKQIKKHWQDVDSGIWEFRGLKRHYTFSKFMCYIGVDRAIKIAELYNKEFKGWDDLKEEIFLDILKRGYHKKEKAFTIYYGSKELDASLLLMAYHEFLPNDNPLLINTIKKIDKELKKNYLVQRYKMTDEMGKSQSAFTICAFWLVDALHYIGEKEKAQKIFNKLIKNSNHLGLFSEDIDLKTKKLIGNFPQAYTHIALINSAILLSEWGEKRKKIDWKKNPVI